jgi:hypothetical protein
LVYRIGFALLGCTLSLSAVALFLIMVSKRSKNPSDNIATVFIAAIVSGVLVWFAIKLFEETVIAMFQQLRFSGEDNLANNKAGAFLL